MIGFDENKISKASLCQFDNDAAFLSAVDGSLIGANKLAHKLISEINLFEKFLPPDHSGLVQACLKTGHSLQRTCDSEGLSIIWVYQVIDKAVKDKLEDFGEGVDKMDYVSLCAQGFSNSNTHVLADWLETSPFIMRFPKCYLIRLGS